MSTAQINREKKEATTLLNALACFNHMTFDVHFITFKCYEIGKIFAFSNDCGAIVSFVGSF